MLDALTFYFPVLTPAVAFVAVAAFLIATYRFSMPIRLVGLAAICIALLPIRMWESVVMATAAATFGILSRSACDWLTTTRFKSVAANSIVVTLVATVVFMIPSGSTPIPSEENLLGTMLPLNWIGVLRWGSVVLLLLVGVPLYLVRFKRGRQAKPVIDSDERSGSRFRLFDLLLCVLAIAFLFASVRIAWPRCDYEPRPVYLLIGAFAGTAVALTAWLIRLGLSFAIFPFVLLSMMNVTPILEWVYVSPSLPIGFDLAPWDRIGLCQFFIAVGGIAVAIGSMSFDDRPRWIRVLLRVVYLTLLIILLLPTVRIYHYMFRPWLTPPTATEVEGNQYAKLTKLMSRINDDRSATGRSRLLDEITAIVKSDAPIVVSTFKFSVGSEQLDSARAFANNATRLLSQGERVAALDRLLFGHRMNRRLSNGGILTSLLVRKACDEWLIDELYSWRRHATVEELEQIQRHLRETVNLAESLETVSQRTNEYNDYVYRWMDGLLEYDLANGRGDGLFSRRIIAAEIDEQILDFNNEDNARIELLITDIAIRRTIEKTGRIPRSLDELVPTYLANVPKDPFGQRSLSYEVVHDGNVESYVLYSFGLNGIDDNGVYDRWDGDIVLRGDGNVFHDKK